jgi:fumarate reductase subunit D
MTPQDQQPQDRVQPVGVEVVRDEDKVHLILAYSACLCLIPFLTVKDSPFVTWHAKQGLVLFGAEMLLAIAFTLLPLGFCLGPLVSLLLLALSVLAILRALKGERWRLPVLADLAEKI